MGGKSGLSKSFPCRLTMMRSRIKCRTKRALRLHLCLSELYSQEGQLENALRVEWLSEVLFSCTESQQETPQQVRAQTTKAEDGGVVECCPNVGHWCQNWGQMTDPRSRVAQGIMITVCSLVPSRLVSCCPGQKRMLRTRSASEQGAVHSLTMVGQGFSLSIAFGKEPNYRASQLVDHRSLLWRGQ